MEKLECCSDIKTSQGVRFMAPLFTDSDQVTSFECSKESSPGMWASYGTTYSLNMRLEKQETQSLIPCNPKKGGLDWFSLSYLRNTWCCLILGALARHKIFVSHSKATNEREGQTYLQDSIAQKQQLQLASGKWRKNILLLGVIAGISMSIWWFWDTNEKIILKRETLENICDERARVLQDQFNVSLNHVHALSILVSTFHHGKIPSAIDQKTFGEYTERTNFERPLTSGVAYALKVPHSKREQFEKEQGWTIKKMETEDQTLVQDCVPENLDPAPIQNE